MAGGVPRSRDCVAQVADAYASGNSNEACVIDDDSTPSNRCAAVGLQMCLHDACANLGGPMGFAEGAPLAEPRCCLRW